MTVIDNERKGRVRQVRGARYRRRRQHGIYHRPIDITDAQLDALQERGYLDPDRRGDRADESEAIELFLADSLTKSR